jgi:hypothetical protein
MNPQVQQMLRERSRALHPQTKAVMERLWSTEAHAEIYTIYKEGYKLAETGSRTEMHDIFTTPEIVASLLATAKENGVEVDQNVFDWQKNRDPELRARLEGAVAVVEEVVEEVTDVTDVEEIPQDPVQ